MSRKVAWLALAAIALLLLLLWLLRGRATSAHDLDSSLIRAALPPPPPEALEDEESVSSDNLARSALNTDAAGSAEAAEAAKGMPVFVLDAITRAPVAGAEVAWLLPEQRLHPSNLSLLTLGWARRIAPRVRTDEAGKAYLPHLTGQFYLAAFDEGRSQDGWFFPGQTPVPIYIVIEPILRQQVQVQDSDGRPVAGAAVGLTRGAQVLAEAFTDAGGMAVLEDLQVVWSGETPPPEDFISLTGPFAGLTGIPFSLRAPPAETPILIMPDWGEVEILLQDHEGRPLQGLHAVQLAHDNPERRGFFGLEPSAASLTLPARDGRVLFPHAGLNLEMQAALLWGGDDYDAVVARFPGPRARGERVTQVIRLESEWPSLALRVLAPDGAPLPGLRLIADYRVEFGVNGTGLVSNPVGVTLDAASSLKWTALRNRSADGADAVKRRYATLKANDPVTGQSWSSEIEVKAPLAPGRNELGEVRLEATPLIAEGRVLLESGEPYRGHVQINVQRRVPGAPDAKSEWAGGFFGSGSGAGGRFRIEGRLPPGEYRLQAQTDECEPAFLPLEVGRSGIEFRLRLKLEIRGIVQLPPSVEHRTVNALLAGPEWQRIARIGKDGSWKHYAPPDGVYSFGLQEDFSGRVVWKMDGIRFVDGKAMEEGFLNVDLRDLLHPIALQVVNTESEPVAGWTIHFPGTERYGWLTLPILAQSRILTTGAPVDFEVTAPGHRITEVRGAQGDQRVVLERGILVTVAIASPRPLPEELEFIVTMYDEAQKAYAQIPLDRQGRGSQHLPAAGSYLLQVSARARQGNRSAMVDVSLDAESWSRRIIAVPLDGLPAAISVGLLPESVEEVRQQVGS